MTESRWLSRMPVYDIAKGRVVGRIHRLIVDADTRKVVGLLLATRLGREPRCLPFRHVHAIGEHAVTVKGTDAIAPISELPDMEEAYRSQRRIYNSPVLTESGSFIGDIEEYTINPQSGRLEAMLVSGGLIKDLFRGPTALPAHLVVAIGEDATIVKDVAVTYLEQRHREQKQKGKSGRTAAAAAAGAAGVAVIRPVDDVGETAATGPERRTGGREHRVDGRSRFSWKDRLRNVLSLPKRNADNVELLHRESSDDTEPHGLRRVVPSSGPPHAPALGDLENESELRHTGLAARTSQPDNADEQVSGFERDNSYESDGGYERDGRYESADKREPEGTYEQEFRYDQETRHEAIDSYETSNGSERDSGSKTEGEDLPPR